MTTLEERLAEYRESLAAYREWLEWNVKDNTYHGGCSPRFYERAKAKKEAYESALRRFDSEVLSKLSDVSVKPLGAKPSKGSDEVKG